MLRYFFVGQLDAFGTAGVRQFSQLLNRVAVIKQVPAALEWRELAQIRPIGNINMAWVLETVKDAVDSRRFDRQLAVISDAYLTWWRSRQ